MLLPPPSATLFPYTTLFRSHRAKPEEPDGRRGSLRLDRALDDDLSRDVRSLGRAGRRSDRKSTRLNSSHSQISYAVFCLKKKRPGMLKSGCSAQSDGVLRSM